VDVFVKGIEVLFDLIPQFKDLQFIDLGGGFKVPYEEGDSETDIEELAEKVREAFAQHPVAGRKPLQVWFEPGKYMVSESGYFITQVNVLKNTSAASFVSVDSGFNHLIRPMFYDAYHRIENISNPNGSHKKYSVVGNICETDTFAWDRMLAEVKEGDYLVFYNAGAYGFEMSSNFNSRFKPAEVMVKDGESFLIRRRDKFDDLLKNQVEVL
jgi:diaminopimelate decarboxylase